MKEVEKEKQEQGRTDEQENTKSAPVSDLTEQIGRHEGKYIRD